VSFKKQLCPFTNPAFVNGAHSHSRQGKAREHGDGLASWLRLLFFSFLLFAVQEFLNRKKGTSYIPKFALQMPLLLLDVDVQCAVYKTSKLQL
jgi:hypothetical protein